VKTSEIADLGAPDSAQENERVQFMRKQSEELAKKIDAVRFNWGKFALFSLAGILVAMIATICADKWLLEKYNKEIDDAYLITVHRYNIQAKDVAEADSRVIDCMQNFKRQKNPDEIKGELKECGENGVLPAAADTHQSDTFDPALLAVVGALVGAALFPVIYLAVITFYRALLGRERNRIEYRIIQIKAQQLQDQIGKDFFTTLVKINFKYLDQYYYQTQEQANKSFMLSLYASIGGAVIIGFGILYLMIGKAERVSYLTTASGIASEFISAVFFYLYNKTVLKMGEYHQKLVLTQNLGISLKITENLPEAERVQAQQMLVSQLTSNINGYLANHVHVPAQASEAAAQLPLPIRRAVEAATG
jgi:hypothetical protein